MKNMKSLVTKILFASMILALFTTSLVQSTASASTSVVPSVSIEENKAIKSESTELKLSESEQVVQAQGLPPRSPTKDPVLTTFFFVLVGFVGVTLATTIVQNAINNGIDAACDKWDHKWGVKQACKVIN